MKNILLLLLLLPFIGFSQTVTTVTTVKDKAGKVLRKDSTTSVFALNPEIIVRDTCITTPPKPPVDTAQSVRRNIISYTDFENVSFIKTGDLPVIKAASGSSDWYNTQSCCTNSITASPIVLSGKTSMMSTLSKGDPEVSGSSRSEIQGRGSALVTNSDKFERWYGLSMYVPAIDPDGKDHSVIQWHHNQGGGSPGCALWISSNKFLIATSKGGKPGSGNVYTRLQDVPIAKKISIVFHIKFSTGSDGLTEMYLDGKLIASIPGANNYPGGNTLKVGVYKWTWYGLSADGTKRQIYYDDIRVGNELATYNDVKP